MPSLNDIFASRLERLGLRIPEIRLPSPSVELSTWAVVACDQYTSDHSYWKAVEAYVGVAPSALRLVLPEIHLSSPDLPVRVRGIHAQMTEYLEQGVLAPEKECAIYVRRTTKRSGLREGLILAVDLERYDYARGSKSLIRATEGTIVDRLPPRLAVRRQASLELPHIMVLFEDPEHQLIEGLGKRRDKLKKLYDLDLMQDGGHLEGYCIDATADIDAILSHLESFLTQAAQRQHTDEPLFWAMGDGNHSLATAKANWEEIKKELLSVGHTANVMTHPARWALVELVNVYSTGLRFEPIHRAIFTAQTDALSFALRSDPSLSRIEPIAEGDLKALLTGPNGQDKSGYFDGKTYYVMNWANGSELPPARVDNLFQRYLSVDSAAKIDFIHGWEDVTKLAGTNASAFLLPVIARERLFSHVGEHGPLPRKAFSMGDAEEKRFYMEARSITR